MIGFLPISILAYALEGGAIVVNKIQLQTRQLNPLAYTFYSGALQGLAIFLFPFGFKFDFSNLALLFSILSGVIFVLALYALYQALQKNEASVAGPLVGAFNPLFIHLLGVIFLSQLLTSGQLTAFYVLILGGLALTFSLWSSRVNLNKGFLWIILSGFLLAISYIFLREAFLLTSFINGLILSRVSAGSFVLLFLLLPGLRVKIFAKSSQNVTQVSALFLFGQTLAAGGNFLIFLATSLTSPALVNAFFGVEYLVILLAALIFAKKAPQLLDENLSRGVLVQKVAGAAVLSLGIYLLSK
ncbi:DMT family transporter [Candidatus Daviesbacteria bacterium]|nr:DMT family transporter [Candidatus Daviesbacteria bacterium]